MIENLCRACGKLPLKPSKRRSPWRRLWRLIIVSASSTFWLSTRESFLCQSGLQEGCRDAYLSTLSEWLLERTEGLGNRAPAQCLPSPPAVLLTSTLWLFCYHSAAQGASFSCFQCWEYRDLCQLARFEWYLRIGTTVVGQLFRRWGLCTGGIAPAPSSLERSFPRCLILTL